MRLKWRGMDARLRDVNVIHSTSYFEFFKNPELTTSLLSAKTVVRIESYK